MSAIVIRQLARWVQDIWYKDAFLGILLLPLACVFSNVVRLRRYLYRKGFLTSCKLPVPVIVVGNITVGGTGKTPLVLWLAEFLQKSGYCPGIISRGYGGQAEYWPQIVMPESDTKQVGDEALLIARNAQMPLVVGPDRVAAAKKLLGKFDCNVLISDDGLQHYKLKRDIEIAVIDGERRFGNGNCLPAGPLREPIERLGGVDFTVVNGDKGADHEVAMHLQGNDAVNLLTGEIKPLADFKGVECHAVAGIGNPGRFFRELEALGIKCKKHSFPDHYQFVRNDIEFGDDKPVLMTEKDAVKCQPFASEQQWYLPVIAVLEPQFGRSLLDLLKQKYDR